MQMPTIGGGLQCRGLETMSKNDDAWQRYFDNTDTLYEIDTEGFALVQADELKHIAKREPRLLAKQDTLNTRPKVFRDHQIAIFPIKNGQYILFSDPETKSFYQFAQDDTELPVEEYSSEIDLNDFDSYPGGQNLNESQALDFAHISSLLRTFTGADRLHLAIRGRTFSGRFQFGLPVTDTPVDVASVQIEIDAGYESEDAIYLVEAKVGKRDNFHIRQLFFPYLEWSRRSDKRIIPIFLIYSNARYYIYEFAFSQVFGELRLVRRKCYTVNESPYADVSLQDMLLTTPPKQEPDVPYPQANDLDKVVDLVGLVGQGVDNKIGIADYFEFDERQGDYYANAARYLGFIERNVIEFRLTDIGEQLLSTSSLSQRNQLVISRMLQCPSIRQAVQLLTESDLNLDSIGVREISRIIENNTDLSGTTVPRRASTIRRWLAWAMENFESRTAR